MSKISELDKDNLTSLRDLAEQGDAEAQFRLSQCLADSDEEESLKWLRKAAGQGYARAQVLLAIHLSNDWKAWRVIKQRLARKHRKIEYNKNKTSPENVRKKLHLARTQDR